MSKSFSEIARHPARFGALAALAIAIAMLAVLVSRMDTSAVHNDALLEMDGNTAFNGGCGFDLPPAGSACTDNAITTSATFDWEGNGTAGTGVCKATSTSDHTITTEPTKPTGVTDTVCTADFAQPDNSYHTGSDKDFQDISNPANPGSGAVWGCSPVMNATNKADIQNAYTALAHNSSGDQLLYFGAERDSENGDVFNGFWFLQNATNLVHCPATTTQDSFSGVHTCGDVLILLNYTSGGRIGTTSAYNWQPGLLGCDNAVGGTGLNADCPNPTAAETHDPLCLIVTTTSGDCRVASAGDALCGRVNGTTTCVIKPSKTEPFPPPCSGPGAFSTPWAPNDAPNTLAPPTFSEAGVNLSKLSVTLPCIAAFMAETRSSPSVTATLKDFTLSPTGEACGSGTRTEIHNVANHGTGSDPDIQSATVAVDKGTVVHDKAFVTPSGPGGLATGTVTYSRWNSNTTCSGTPDNTETVTISPGIPANTESTTQVPDSSFYTTTGAPGISYRATYNAVAPYTNSTSLCEPLKVVNPTTITTLLSGDGQGPAAKITVHIGSAVTDSATLSGQTSDAGGTVTYTVYTENTCTTVFANAGTKTVVNGVVPDSNAVTMSTAGTFYWQAVYSGDTNNKGSKSVCGDEVVLVINPSTSLVKAAAPVVTATYSYGEKNTGDTILTSPSVSDDKCTPVVQDTHDIGGGVLRNTGDSNNDGNFDPGETWAFKCTTTKTLLTGTGTNVSVQNTATATATDPLGVVLTETDKLTVTMTVTVTRP